MKEHPKTSLKIRFSPQLRSSLSVWLLFQAQSSNNMHFHKKIIKFSIFSVANIIQITGKLAYTQFNMSTITSRIQNQIHTLSFFHIFVSVALPPKKIGKIVKNGHILHRKKRDPIDKNDLDIWNQRPQISLKKLFSCQ